MHHGCRPGPLPLGSSLVCVLTSHAQLLPSAALNTCFSGVPLHAAAIAVLFVVCLPSPDFTVRPPTCAFTGSRPHLLHEDAAAAGRRRRRGHGPLAAMLPQPARPGRHLQPLQHPLLGVSFWGSLPGCHVSASCRWDEHSSAQYVSDIALLSIPGTCRLATTPSPSSPAQVLLLRL